MKNGQGKTTQNGNVDSEVQNNGRSEDEEPAEKQAVPDGGWGWMCVLGSAIGHVIFGVIVRAFGVTYLALLERYGASATATAWVGAINFCGTGFLGPVVSALCRRFNCRRVTMVGGALVALGVVATGFAPNIYVTYVTYGVVTGIGLGMASTPGYLIIGQYFDKKKALAMAVASFSSGIGALISPPLLLLLFRHYGFTGMFVIVGGLCLNVCVGGALYRPLKSQEDPKMTNVEKNPSHIEKESEKELKPADVFISAEEKASGLEKCENGFENVTDASDAFICDEKKYTYTNDSGVYANDQANQPLSTPKTNEKGEKELAQASVNTKGLGTRYSRLLTNHSFLALTFLVFSLCFALGLISGFLPALAVENGISGTKAAWLLSVSGICSMTSTLILGPVLDVPAVRQYRLHTYNAANVLVGAGTLLFGLVSNYAAYITIAVIFSSAAGVLMSQRATAIADIVGSTSDAEGFGLVLMLGSIGSLLGRSLAGSIKDFWGAYSGAFYLSGGLSLLSAAIFQLTLIRRTTRQTTQ